MAPRPAPRSPLFRRVPAGRPVSRALSQACWCACSGRRDGTRQRASSMRVGARRTAAIHARRARRRLDRAPASHARGESEALRTRRLPRTAPGAPESRGNSGAAPLSSGAIASERRPCRAPHVSREQYTCSDTGGAARARHSRPPEWGDPTGARRARTHQPEPSHVRRRSVLADDLEARYEFGG